MAAGELHPKIADFSKLLISVGLVGATIYVGEWIGILAARNLSNLSLAAGQAIAAFQFVPMGFAFALVARYSARLLTPVPLTGRETLYRFEKSAVRGMLSAIVLLGGFAWWVWQIMNVEMLMHPIFTWSTPLIVVGIWLTSWYHSKRGVYRKAIHHREQVELRNLSKTPFTLSGLFGGLIRGEIELADIGFQRGLPVLMFKFRPRNESTYELNFGLDRSLPTFMASKSQPDDRMDEYPIELENLRRSLKDEIQQLSEEKLQSLDYRKTQKIQSIAPQLVYQQNVTHIESLAAEEASAVKDYYRKLSDFEEYIKAYSERKGGGNIQRRAEPLIQAKKNAIRALVKNIED